MKNTPLLLLALIFSLLIVPTTYAASGGDGDITISDSYDKEKAEAEAEAKAKAKAEAEAMAKDAAEAKAKEKAAAEAKAKAYETTAKAKEAAELRAKAKEAEAKAKAAAEEQSKSKTEAKNTNQDSKSQEGKNDNNSSQQVEITAQVDENSLQDAGNGNIKMPTEEQLQEEGERRQEEEQDERVRMVDVVNQEDERQRNQDETQDEIDERLREQREQRQQEARERENARDDAEQARQRAIDIEERVRERREREAAANALEERQAQIEQARTAAQEQRENYIRTLGSSRELYTQEASRHNDTRERISTELHRIERLDANNITWNLRQLLLRAIRDAQNAAARARISANNVSEAYTSLIGLIEQESNQGAIATAENRIRAAQSSYTLTALRDLESAIRHMAATARDANTMSAEDANEEINNNLRERYQSGVWNEDGAEGRRRSAQNQYNDARNAERNANEAFEESRQARENQENETPEERARAAEEQRIVDEVRILSNYETRLREIDAAENRNLEALQRNPFGGGASEQELASSLREQAYFELNQFMDPDPFEENTRARDNSINRTTDAHNTFVETWDNTRTLIPEVCSSHFEVLDLNTCVSSVYGEEINAQDRNARRARQEEIINQLSERSYNLIKDSLLSLRTRFQNGNIQIGKFRTEWSNLRAPLPEFCAPEFRVLEFYPCISNILYREGLGADTHTVSAAYMVIQNRLRGMDYNSTRARLLSIKSEFLGEFASTSLNNLLRMNNNAYLSRRDDLGNTWTRLDNEARTRYENLLRQQPQYTEYQIETIRIQDAADDQRTEALRIRDAALAALEEN